MPLGEWHVDAMPMESFLEIARKKKPNIIALSALLTTTMIEMKNVIDALKEAGLRDTAGVIVHIGGNHPWTHHGEKNRDTCPERCDSCFNFFRAH